MVNQDPKDFKSAQLRYFFRRVLSRIKQKPRGYFVFKKLRGACGLCYWGEGIKIDPRKEIIPTIIHEVLHDLYPKNWEGWTLRVESKIVNILKPRDIYMLLNLFFSKMDISTKKSKKKKKTKKRQNR